MLWLIITIILIIVIVLILWSTFFRQVATDFIKSPEVRNLASSFASSVVKPSVLSRCRIINPYLTDDQITQLD